jgi:hypothetical protein
MATPGNKQKTELPDCADRDNETQQKINAVKKIYCQDLDSAENTIDSLKIGYEANQNIYISKERRYLSTKENCQRYINTEISMGSQLVQANDKIKASVANFKILDDSLATQLTTIFQSVKDVKTKMSDLRDAATKLGNSKKDSCNASQWNAITGRGDAKDGQPSTEPDACKDIEKVIDLLFDMPDALLLDIDAVFKSSSDIIGIQKFCNTGSVVGLQDKLYTQAKEFDGLLLDTIKLRKADLDARQQELKDALANRTGSVMDLYSQRCTYRAIHTTLDQLCCPQCGCVINEAGDCKPRLERCAKEICDICGQVKFAFVKEDTPPPVPQPA